MREKKKSISIAVNQLSENLSDVGRVSEWAELIGYEDPKEFSEDFIRHYDVRPHKMMDLVRIKSIIKHLRDGEKISNHRIARAHSLPDEKALNNYLNYHLGYAPREIKSMPTNELQSLLDDHERKIQK